MYDPTGRLRTGDTLKTIFGGAIGLIVIVVILVLIFGSTASNLSGRTQRLAQGEADKYLEQTGLTKSQDAKAVCVNVDSDGDGYVSCPYVTKDGVTHPLECAGSMTVNTGCRPPKAVFTQPVQYPIPR